MNKKEQSIPDNLTIKTKLDEVHEDLKRFMEQSSQQHLESVLAGSRRDFLNSIIEHVVDDIDEGLDNNMVKECQMQKTCKSNFTKFLRENANLLKHDGVAEDTILGKQSELEEMRNNAPYDQCGKCFQEVSNLSDKQVKLMRSLRIYNTGNDQKKDIVVLPEDSIVTDILEPLSNRQRLQILKAVAIETKTFSALSKLTGLRGGNLLFHLQKLLDTDMILQRHERGDYMITDKGFKVLKGISDVHSMLMS